MAEQVRCAGCGKQVTQTKAGVLRSHQSRTPEWPGSPFTRRCAQSGQAPAGDPAAAGAPGA